MSSTHPARRRLTLTELEARETPAFGAAGPEFAVTTSVTNARSSATIASDSAGNTVVVWQSDGQDGSGYGVYAQRYTAAGAAQGGEFRVNTATAGAQLNPAAAMDADGDFVVAWQSNNQDGSGYGVYAQRYTAAGAAQGAEFLVNTVTAGPQRNPAVAMDADGDFVVAWDSNNQDGSGYGVHAQRYTAAGAPQGAETRVNTAITNDQRHPALAMAAGGDFVVAWDSFGQDGSGYGVYAQRYTAAGALRGAETRVNTATAGPQRNPAVAMDADGDFVVAWDSLDGSGYGVYAQRYAAGGAPQGAETRVNTAITNHQLRPAVAMAAGGDFVVAWESSGQDGSGYGVYAQRYTAAGAPQGAETRVNTATVNGQRIPAAAMDSDGDFVIAWRSELSGTSDVIFQRFAAAGPPIMGEVSVSSAPATFKYAPAAASDPAGNTVVVWTSNGQDGSGNGVYARLYDAAGAPRGPEFPVSTVTANNQTNPTVAMDADGDFVVAWQADGNQDGAGTGVFARRFTADGAGQGNDFTVNAATAGNQYRPAAAMDAAGNFVVAWDSTTGDGSGYGVYVRRFNAAGAPQTGDVLANFVTANSQFDPAVAMAPTGAFVVSWTSQIQDGSSDGVFARQFNAAGVAQGGADIAVNGTTLGEQSASTVAIEPDGDFVVAWHGLGSTDVYARRFSSAGFDQTGEVQVNATTHHNQRYPAVATDADGDFVVTWQSYGQDGSFDGVYAQRMNGAGFRIAAEFQVSTYTTNAQSRPAIVMNGRGDPTVFWQGGAQLGSASALDAASGIYGQRYADNVPPTLAGTPISASIDELQPYTFTAAGADADGDQPLKYSLAGAPSGAAIDPDTGVFTWTPAEAQGGDTYVFNVTVSDGIATATQSVTLIVREVNSAPVLTETETYATGTLVRGLAHTFTVTADDADGAAQSLTYSLIGPPAGAFIHPDTGEFSWTPGGTVELGDYTFTVRVADDGSPGKSATQAVTLTVTDAAVVAGDLVIGGTAGADKIDVKPAKAVGFLDVVINGDLVNSFAVGGVDGITGKIQVRGLEMADKVTIDKKVTLPTELLGGSGNDTLLGGAGADSLDGGTGNDSLAGGTGADLYRFVGTWGKDKVTEAANAGADRLDFSAVTAAVNYAKTASLAVTSGVNTVAATGTESLTGGAGLDTLTAPTGNNLFTLTGLNAGTAGTFAFIGVENVAAGVGLDTLKVLPGGSLTGTFVGGAGKNALDYSAFAAASPVTVNLLLGIATGAAGATGVVNVTGGAGDDLIVGNDAANVLFGGLGRDVLIGGNGADTLDGGLGEDLLIAGFTDYDPAPNPAEFDAVRGEWSRTGLNSSYAERVVALKAGVAVPFFGTVRLDENTVSDDLKKDSLTGGNDLDWFIVSPLDVLKDQIVGTETKTTV